MAREGIMKKSKSLKLTGRVLELEGEPARLSFPYGDGLSDFDTVSDDFKDESPSLEFPRKPKKESIENAIDQIAEFEEDMMATDIAIEGDLMVDEINTRIEAVLGSIASSFAKLLEQYSKGKMNYGRVITVMESTIAYETEILKDYVKEISNMSIEEIAALCISEIDHG